MASLAAIATLILACC